jgi:hypothetical protein
MISSYARVPYFFTAIQKFVFHITTRIVERGAEKVLIFVIREEPLCHKLFNTYNPATKSANTADYSTNLLNSSNHFQQQKLLSDDIE